MSHHGYEHPICTPVQCRVIEVYTTRSTINLIVDVLVYYCTKVEIISVEWCLIVFTACKT